MQGLRLGYFYVVWCVLLIGIDQLTKQLALHYCAMQDYAIFPGLTMTLSFNRGITFGWLSFESATGFYLVAVVSAATLLFFAWYTWSRYREGLSISAEILVLAGGISNFIDRVVYGAVIDFIDIFYRSFHWHTFNLADSYIVIGVLLMLLYSIRA